MLVLRISSANYLPSVWILYRIVGRPYTSKHRVLTDFCEEKVVLRCGGILFLEVCTRIVKYTGQKREREREEKKKKESEEKKEREREKKKKKRRKREGHQKQQTDKQSLR